MSSTAPSMDLKHRNLYLHGLRGVLSFAILVYHAAHSGLPTFTGAWFAPINYFLLSLNHCVELFFGISGIVVLFAYQKSRSAVAFMINRATRIFPVLWTTILVIVALSFFAPEHGVPTDPLTILINFLALPTVFSDRLIHPAAWSLSFEFCFYAMFLLFALLAKLLNPRQAFYAITVLALVLISANPIAAMFLVGVCVALTAEHTAAPPRLRIESGIFLLIALLCWRAAELYSGDDNNGRALLQPMAMGFYLIAVASAYRGLRGVFYGQGYLARLLVHRSVLFLGTISYSLYLWQVVVMGPVKKAFHLLNGETLCGPWSQLVFLLIVIPPTLIISTFSQRYLEVRMTNYLRRRFERRPPLHS